MFQQNSALAFDFESHSVRIVRDEDGTPWFNAKDVCDALGHKNPRKALVDHVDEDDVTKRYAIDGVGRSQQINHVNESGLYALIFGSRMEVAKRFKRWVTSDVLPTLRKTGAYASSTAMTPAPSTTTSISASPLREKVDALMAVGESLAKTKGVHPGIAMAAALDAVQESTGLDVSAFRRALPSSTQPLALENGLLPSPAAYEDPLALVDPAQLAAALASSTSEVNVRLEELGLQQRSRSGEWELTGEGEEWGAVAPHVKGILRPHNLLWRQEVVEWLLGGNDEDA